MSSTRLTFDARAEERVFGKTSSRRLHDEGKEQGMDESEADVGPSADKGESYAAEIITTGSRCQPLFSLTNSATLLPAPSDSATDRG
jgi:hypothetical protein